MKKADIVIVGGGVIGAAIASSLAREIKDVLLIEKEGIAAQASGSNYGIVDCPRAPGFEYKAVSRSLELYDDLVENHFDLDIEYEKVGGLIVGFTPAQSKVLKWYCKSINDIGVDMEFVDGREVAELEPNLNPDIIAGAYCENDVQVNPYKTVMAFANLARRRGAAIQCGTEVTKINLTAGKVYSVDTTAGTIETSAVIVANSYMSRQLMQTIGIDIPIFPQRLQSLVTAPQERLLTRIVQGARCISDEEAEDNPEYAVDYDYPLEWPAESGLPTVDVEKTVYAFLKPTTSGSIVLGTTCEFVGTDRRTTPQALSAIAKETLKICPALANANIIRTWSGLIPYTFDGKPILGKIPDIGGLYIAAGHPHAMSHAPAVGEIFAELIMKEYGMSEFAKSIFDETSIQRHASS